MSSQKSLVRDQKSGGAMAEHRRLAKSDVRYWEAKLYHEAYTRDEKRVELVDWSVRLQHGGRREAFALDTPNKTAAAKKARDIFLSLRGSGWDATLERFKPTAKPVIRDATVGSLIKQVEANAGLRPKTFADYAKAFRKIVADIRGIDGGTDKFNPHTGGRQQWIEKIDAVLLSDITPEKVQRWKLNFLKKAAGDVMRHRRAQISVNSLLRQAKSLFSKKVMRFLTLDLPNPLPFDGVAFEPRQSMRYHGVIDVVQLLGAARSELARGEGDRPEQYKVFLLSLCAGLRRNEIDKLEWAAVDTDQNAIRIQATEFFRPKTEESAGDVEIDLEIASIFSSLRAKATGPFVIESDRQPIINAAYSAYRCQSVFDGLVAWLRGKGVTAQKPLHELRKEFGSTIANEHGIYAASRALRHTDIGITTRHYADARRRVAPGSESCSQLMKILISHLQNLQNLRNLRRVASRNRRCYTFNTCETCETVAKKLQNEGLTEPYVRKITGRSETIDEEFLRNHVWWWQSLENSCNDPANPIAAIYKLTFDLNERRSAYLYELGARVTRKFEFDSIWFDLPDEKKKLLGLRWPEAYVDTAAAVVFVGGQLDWDRQGWSRPKVLSFNLKLPDATIFSDLKEKFAAWRLQLGIEDLVRQRQKQLSWDVIEYMDRKYLLGEPSDSDKDSWVAQKRTLYAKESKEVEKPSSRKPRR